MKTTAEQVKIVEYHQGLAKGIAKMWNESRENWGGDSGVTTESDVIEKESNSTNLHLFLAMYGDEVVGYCGLSQYREDTGALYIPLLNVHPSYQGLKIGKQLVLKALERTIELDWPRLDLFTWAGNTKAVPLYKKCGFFWEERDDSTHLMNFIPLVMSIDCLRPFFEKHDWYSTSERVIEVKPDGIRDNDYTYFEYNWRAGEEYVRVQVERTGRGIRLIETQDFLIDMSLQDFKLLENQTHSVTYRMVNKTGRPMEVTLTGKENENVEHSFYHSCMVDSEWTGEFPVKVTIPSQEPNPWKTHPAVSAVMTIDGSPIPLNMGVFPKQAAKVHLRTVRKDWRSGQKGLVHLDIESQMEEDCIYHILLPDNSVLEWDRKEIAADIKGKDRVSFPLSAKLMKNAFLSEEIEVRVERENKGNFTFRTNLSLAFPGYGSKFGGETEEHWFGFNGAFYVEVEKRNHIVKAGSIYSSGEALVVFSPKLGKPFSEEFSKKEASHVEFIELVEGLVIKTSLESDAFPNVTLNTYIKVFGDGLIEINHEIINKGTESLVDIFLMQPVYPELKNMAIPQKDGVIIGSEAFIPFMDYIKDKEISESWIFVSGNNGDTTGFSWPEGAKGRKDDWRFGIEYAVETLNPQQEVCFGPISIGINTAPTWERWREFIMGEEAPRLKEIPLYALEASGGDFISEEGGTVEYSLRSMLTPYIHGSLKLKSEGDFFERCSQKEDEATKISVQAEHNSPGLKRITGFFHAPGQRASLEAIQFVKGKKEVTVEETNDVWTVDNGMLSFKSSPSYFPGIYSLIVDGKENLHHQFPEAGPKAWWNPWGGGIRYFFQNVSSYSMMKELTRAEPVTRTDQNGHTWTGLCLTTKFKEHEKMKGIILKQYALTLPEVGVLACYAEVHQQTGRTFKGELLDMEAFFKPGDELSACYAEVPSDGVFERYYAGIEEFMLGDSDYVSVGSDDRENAVTLIHSDSRKLSELYMNQEVFVSASTEEWSASSGETFTVKPTILLFGEGKIGKAIKPIKGITFR
ncbi:GNAT family N-acetyltransferase [Rossellomorea vietnamensis]|uniref:GNAT family N-acetyltransferase n=1 Tax=Rossellomorea vietnamensis TaxID=218284 RepID=A0A5D4K9B3_9BACI|nr:GNAT family N-acetyltransferase [Rossellomorea vietnamensis]TYR73974.1 GNAT family N-acetyltransferase [Rossellomorea vietnamensis]